VDCGPEHLHDKHLARKTRKQRNFITDDITVHHLYGILLSVSETSFWNWMITWGGRLSEQNILFLDLSNIQTQSHKALRCG